MKTLYFTHYYVFQHCYESPYVDHIMGISVIYGMLVNPVPRWRCPNESLGPITGFAANVERNIFVFYHMSVGCCINMKTKCNKMARTGSDVA